MMHGHRRRRSAAIWLAGAAAVVVIVGAAVTAGMLRLQRDDSDAPAAAVPDDPSPARRPGQITIDLDPTSGYVASVRGTDATRQFITARDFTPGLSGETGRYAGEVSAYDPGTFDGASLTRGELVTVAGHDARYVPDFTFAERSDGRDEPHRTPMVAWADPSGVWILVYRAAGQQTDRETLQRLAASVTLAPPKELRTPFRLGAMPAGLAASYVRSVEDEQEGRSGTVGFSGPGRKASAAAVYEAFPSGITVSVSAAGRDDDWTAEKADLTGKGTAGGHPSWYSTGKNPLTGRSSGGALVVETGQCVIRLNAADRAKVSRDDLDQIVANMAIGDCADPDTWIAPLS